MLKVPKMHIPVFVSAPSPDNLSPDQEASRQIIHRLMKRYRLDWRALGRSDYPVDSPLREVARMVRHCSGGIILGFTQFRADTGSAKPGSVKEAALVKPAHFPTPWNQLEAGILYGAGLPLIIFREQGIDGGIFDVGTSEVWVHHMPSAKSSAAALDDLDFVFQNWLAKVKVRYYGY